MGLHFPADDRPPEFMQIARFSTMGLVINVFLLDPSARILAAFVYNLDTETICLYLIPDWEKREYVLINTGIACVRISHACSKIHFLMRFFAPTAAFFQLVMYNRWRRCCHSLRRECSSHSVLLPRAAVEVLHAADVVRCNCHSGCICEIVAC